MTDTLARAPVRWLPVSQKLVDGGIRDVPGEVREALGKVGALRDLPAGSRVGVCVGSRGIACLDEMVKEVVRALREAGSTAFIVPAMGSHGGATARGQVAVLAELGVTEPRIGARIRATMDTVVAGRRSDGQDILVDRIAFEEMDYLIPVARIKPHTDFRGHLESGIHKLLAIGLGKQSGASALHALPISRFSSVIEEVGGVILQRGRVLAAIAVVEDGYHRPGIIEAIRPPEIPLREPQLLRTAREWLPRLPFSEADVLLVQQIGKDVSGAGMDPNVTGRYPEDGMGRQKAVVDIQRIVVLDLTEKTRGNAAGIGLADIVTRRAADKVDWAQTYTNHRTARLLSGAKLPVVTAHDREGLQFAVDTLVFDKPEDWSREARIAWIRDTSRVADLWLSEALYQDIRDPASVWATGPVEEMRFCIDGQLEMGDRGMPYSEAGSPGGLGMPRGGGT